MSNGEHATPMVPRLVAHRGYARHYPENTLPAVRAALEAGVCHVEVDVQMSADGVPVLFHDATLERTTDRGGVVMDLEFAALSRITAGEPRRFGDRFQDVTIPALSALAAMLAEWPDVTLFVEIKSESLMRFGTTPVVRAVLSASAGLGERAIPIAYDRGALETVRHLSGRRIGWILARPDPQTHARACELQPDFLFCNHAKLAPARGPETTSPLWSGPWHWVLYEITDPALALAWHRRGADYIETMAVGELLRHPLFGKQVRKQGPS